MAKSQAKPKPTGRPSKYSVALAEQICAEIAVGKSLKTICTPASMPSVATIYSWMDKADGFLEMYTRAKAEQADYLFEELCSLCDEEPPRDDNGRVDNGWVNRQRLRVDTRKWAASKLKPKAYGEKLDVTSEVRLAPDQLENQLGALLGKLAGGK